MPLNADTKTISGPLSIPLCLLGDSSCHLVASSCRRDEYSSRGDSVNLKPPANMKGRLSSLPVCITVYHTCRDERFLCTTKVCRLEVEPKVGTASEFHIIANPDYKNVWMNRLLPRVLRTRLSFHQSSGQMNLKILPFLGLVFFLAIDPCLGKETNASRFRRGLPPLPPRFVSRSKGATASATISSRPSSTPRPHFSSRSDHSGRIQVFANNGSSLGYVRNSTPISINFGGDPEQELRIQTGFESAPFDILKPLGASASSSGTLDKLTTVALSSPDQASRLDTSGSGKGFIQSAIWSMDPNTQELKAQYVNPDGIKSALFVEYEAFKNELYFANDIDSAKHGLAVKLYLSED
ncbi:hypothetical protein B0H17DRAFT_361556 [Mycena rosella]|uniref:Uncharacterized protein n=1 Tax=Mycena rosella TaxID=1033263 RepID=A0AAD7MB21_MYCRO|nr:hypothetical protein B0H17DRAFT_361556 [Mycena rosella]